MGYGPRTMDRKTKQVDERQARRIARNEARFREMNERQVDALDAFDVPARRIEVICECAISECDDMLSVARETYETVRSNPTWFLVRPDHVVSHERPVRRSDDYWIVEKVGEAARIARELDDGAAGR